MGNRLADGWLGVTVHAVCVSTALAPLKTARAALPGPSSKVGMLRRVCDKQVRGI